MQMSNMPKFLFLAAAIYVWQNHSTLFSGNSSSVQKLADQPIPNDPCLGKAKCVMIFVAPWCGACKQKMPDILRARDVANSSTGVRLFATSDEPEKLRELAASMGGQVIVDEDESFQNKWNAHTFPAFYVLDAAGNQLSQDKEAILWVYEKILYPGKKFMVK